MFDLFVYLWIGLSILTFFVLLRVSAPYGRHARSGWGRSIPAWIGWTVMEIVSPIAFCTCLAVGRAPGSPPVLVFASLWVIHYINRSLIQPFRSRSSGREMPLAVVGMAVVFNSINGFVVGYGLARNGSSYTDSWLISGPFVVGLGLFVAGASVNLHSDAVLMRLKRDGGGSYGIPRGGFFRFVTAPNYLGEMIEWVGFAVMTWSLPALSFAIWTAANLIPRALSHHAWYLDNFPDYPAKRKAIIPGIL